MSGRLSCRKFPAAISLPLAGTSQAEVPPSCCSFHSPLGERKQQQEQNISTSGLKMVMFDEDLQTARRKACLVLLMDDW